MILRSPPPPSALSASPRATLSPSLFAPLPLSAFALISHSPPLRTFVSYPTKHNKYICIVKLNIDKHPQKWYNQHHMDPSSIVPFTPAPERKGNQIMTDDIRILSIKKQGVSVNDAKRPLTVPAPSWCGAPRWKRIVAAHKQAVYKRLTDFFVFSAFLVVGHSGLNHKERKERKEGSCRVTSLCSLRSLWLVAPA